MSSSRSGETGAVRAGRPRDAALEPLVLGVALDVIGELGFRRMTLDLVAERAGVAKTTIYRRWATKQDLALAAVDTLGGPFDDHAVPDTGDLRSDLIAIVESGWIGGTERRIAVLAGFSSALPAAPELAAAIAARIAEPYVDGYRTVLRRAVDRGRLARDVDLDVLAEAVPAMATYRLMFTDRPLDRDFFVAVVDHLVLPAAGAAAGLGPLRTT